jgi:hypothetical protein
MTVMQPHISYAAWFSPTALLGIAIGIQTSLLVVFVSICAQNHLIATAVSLVTVTPSFGGSIRSGNLQSNLRGLKSSISFQRKWEQPRPL